MTLESLRKEMDGINAELLELFSRRLELAKKIAQVKKLEKLPVLDAAREEQEIGRIRELSKQHALSPDVMEDVFADFIAYSRTVMKMEMSKHG